MKAVLGLPMLTFYGVGMILGAGIYSLIGKAAAIAGNSEWMSVLIAAAIAALAAFSYAELASMFPKAGGEYTYLRQAFPQWRWIASSVGLTMIFSGLCSTATVALAFSGYVQQFFTIAPQFAALALLVTFTAVNFVGIKESTWTNVAFTLIEASGLVLFVFVGFQSPTFGDALSVSVSELFSTTTLGASALIIFAYFGFENIVNFAEETKSPERTLPRAILLSVGIAATLYVLVTLAALALVPIEVLSTSSAPLADAVSPVSPRIASVLSGIALFATANTALVLLATTSRIVFSMARDRELHHAFAILSRRHSPWIASVVALAMASLLVLFFEIKTLASVASFSTMLAFIVVHITVITLRFRSPDLPRPFKAPLNISKFPILPGLGLISTIVMLFQFDLAIDGVAFSILILIVCFQLLKSYLSNRKET